MTLNTREQVRQAYKIGAASYDERRSDSPRGSLLYLNEKHVFENLLPPGDEHAAVMEIGAGTGKFTVPALERGYSVLATDVNQEMVDLLRERVAACGGLDRCRMDVADVFDLAHPDGTFDLVYAVHVIPRFRTLDDQRAAIAEIARVIRPGGHFLFDFRNRKALAGAFYRRHAATLREIREMLETNSLEPVEVRGARFLMNRTLLNTLPMFGSRAVARLDRGLANLWSKRSWDVFVLARKCAADEQPKSP